MGTIQECKPHNRTLGIHPYLYLTLPATQDRKMLHSLRCTHTHTSVLQGLCVSKVGVSVCMCVAVCVQYPQDILNMSRGNLGFQCYEQIAISAVYSSPPNTQFEWMYDLNFSLSVDVLYTRAKFSYQAPSLLWQWFTACVHYKVRR